MVDLVYRRVVSLLRSVKVVDATNGSRMEERAYARDVVASIQPKRDRNVTPQNMPSAVSTMSADSMTTWKILIQRAPAPVLKNDTIIDDFGVQYKVELVYDNAFGLYIEARIMTP